MSRFVKIFRKRNSNCTVVQIATRILTIFAYDRLIGVRITENNDELRSYFCDVDYKEKQTAEHEITKYPYIRVSEKELNDLLVTALKNILGE